MLVRLNGSGVVFSAVLVLFGMLFAAPLSGGELETPRPEWFFYSGWQTQTGSSTNAIEDGGKWDDHKYNALSVTATPPPGSPEPGNALRIDWSRYIAGDCSGGANHFVELFPSVPNPFYARVYFYSGAPAEVQGCGGRKFMYFKNAGGYGGCALYLYDAGGANVRLHIKNHAYDSGYNTATSEHLDGRYAWPGKQSEGIVGPGQWYCIEFAHYRHNSNGWLKAWLNGKLVINASKNAWGVGTYDTDTGHATNWLQMPSYRNGGVTVSHSEYFDNFILSSAYIGPAFSGPGPDTEPPGAPTGLAVR